MKHTAGLLALMTVSGLAYALSGQVTDASGKPISGVAELETAQDQDAQGVSSGGSQQPHVHGLAELLVVLEGQQLDIELRSPAINLLGFEHHANSPEQQIRMESAKDTLADANSLFHLDSAGCQLTDHGVDFSSVVKGRAQHDKDHHEEEHDADHHDKYHEAHGHSDIEAYYRYRCEQPDELRSLTTTISIEFPDTRSLQVQWIVNGRQGATTLDNGQHRIVFR